MEQRNFARLLLFFLGFTYLLLLNSCAAVPTTRSFFKPNMEQSSSIQDLVSQYAVGVTEKLVAEGEVFIEGRMLETTVDYPGTGANNHHDPKTPGRA